MGWWHDYKARWEARQKRRVIARLRGHMAAFGVPVDDFTDKEIERGVIAYSRMVGQAGISTQEAIDAMRVLSRAAGAH